MSLSSKKCCVPGCMDLGGMQTPLHLFPNPMKDRVRFNKWVIAIGGDIIGLDSDDIYKHRRICHAHFEPKFCCRYGRLCNIATPTLNLPGPLSLPKFTFVEKRPLRQKQYSSEKLPSTSKEPLVAIADVSTFVTEVKLAEKIYAKDCQASVTSELESIQMVQDTDLEEKNKDPRVLGSLQFVSGYFVHSARKRIFKNCQD